MRFERSWKTVISQVSLLDGFPGEEINSLKQKSKEEQYARCQAPLSAVQDLQLLQNVELELGYQKDLEHNSRVLVEELYEELDLGILEDRKGDSRDKLLNVGQDSSRSLGYWGAAPSWSK